MNSYKIIMRLTGNHMSNVNEHYKNYPYRRELYELLKNTFDCHVTMLGDYIGRYNYWLGKVHTQDELNVPIYGDTMLLNLSYAELQKQIATADVWVAIDSFFHHATAITKKRGVAILGPYKKESVGYPWNINLELDSKYQQPSMVYGEDKAYVIPREAFPSPEVVVQAIKEILEGKNNV